MSYRESKLQTAQISELCKRTLLSYADSFCELAKNYDREFQVNEWEERTQIIAERRLWESRQILKQHLYEMARVMSEVACKVIQCRRMEEKQKRVLEKGLKVEGILIENPCFVSGEDDKEALMITMRTDKIRSFSAEDAADMISVLLDRRMQLSYGSPLLIEKSPHNYVLDQEPDYMALTGFAKVMKQDESVSGDNYAVSGDRTGHLTVMLSDGTGSGGHANEESEKVLNMMEKFLEAGYDTEASIQMVNTAVYTMDSDENHPTLDLVEIDLYRGSCIFRKAAGAVSFLKRGDDVECIPTGTLPLGIFQRIETMPVERKLQDGDYIIMMTDGVIDAFKNLEYEETICEVIAQMKEQNPNELAQRLLRTAIIAGEGKVLDDMTVSVIGIWRT